MSEQANPLLDHFATAPAEHALATAGRGRSPRLEEKSRTDRDDRARRQARLPAAKRLAAAIALLVAIAVAAWPLYGRVRA